MSRASSFQKVRVAMMVVAMATALVVTLVSASSRTAKAGAFPGANGKIAFTRSRTGENDIFVMNSDGTGVKRLTDINTANTASDDSPAWSPNGKKIAFTSNRDGDSDIFVMKPDGTNLRKITKNAAIDVHPDWCFGHP